MLEAVALAVIELVGVLVGVTEGVLVGVRVGVFVVVEVGVGVGVGGWGMTWRASTMAFVSLLVPPMKVMVIAPPLGAILLMTSSKAVFAPTWA